VFLPFRTHDPTQPTKNPKISTQPNPTQPNPWVDPTHVNNSASASVLASSSENKDNVFLVKFRSWEKLIEAIRRRKSLKGTRISIAEDLTKLNVKTLNRAKSSELVSKVWLWKRRSFALL